MYLITIASTSEFNFKSWAARQVTLVKVLCHSSLSIPSVASPVSQLILQLFRCFAYVTAHCPSLPSLHLGHSSFSNSSVASPTSQLIVHPFPCFTYVTAHSPTLPLLHLRHSSLSIPSVASPNSQFILQLFRCFTYVTAHCPSLLSLHLRHSSLPNPFVAPPTSPALHQRHLASRPCFKWYKIALKYCLTLLSLYCWYNRIIVLIAKLFVDWLCVSY